MYSFKLKLPIAIFLVMGMSAKICSGRTVDSGSSLHLDLNKDGDSGKSDAVLDTIHPVQLDDLIGVGPDTKGQGEGTLSLIRVKRGQQEREQRQQQNEQNQAQREQRQQQREQNQEQRQQRQQNRRGNFFNFGTSRGINFGRRGYRRGWWFG